MKLLKRLKSPAAVRAIIVGKLCVLGAIWFSLDDGFRLGDKPVSAEEAASETAPPTTPKAGEQLAQNESEETKATASDAGKTRKSFLSNLLELPKLNPEAIKKEELGRYLEIAERKKRQIEERLDLLKRREDQLKNLETSIDGKLRQLDEERRFFAQTIQQEKVLKGERTEKLITLYAKMEPKKAAPVFEKLDKDLVVELFKNIPQKQITTILESMNPEKSVEISEYYGRVRSAREYDLLREMNMSLRKEFDDCKGMPAE